MSERPSATASSTPRTRAMYRAALGEDWGKQSFNHAQQLLEQILRDAGWVLRSPSEPAPRGLQPKSPVPYPIRDDAPEYLREFMERLNEQMMPSVPRSVPERRDEAKLELAHRSTMATRLLNLQTTFALHGDVEFVRDVQALLFFSCLHWLLPQLRANRLHEEHDVLLNQLRRHQIVCWRDDLAQYAFMEAQLLEYVEAPDAATEEALRVALSVTPTNAHDYLTKVHALWFQLLETGALDQAEDLLVRVLRSVAPEQLAEVKEMLRLTYGQHRGRPKRSVSA